MNQDMNPKLSDEELEEYTRIAHRYLMTFGMYDKCTTFRDGHVLRRIGRDPEEYAERFSLIEEDVRKIDDAMESLSEMYGPLYVYISGDYAPGTIGTYWSDKEILQDYHVDFDDREYDPDEVDYQDEPERRGFSVVFMTCPLNPNDRQGFCILGQEVVRRCDKESIFKKVHDRFLDQRATKSYEHLVRIGCVKPEVRPIPKQASYEEINDDLESDDS